MINRIREYVIDVKLFLEKDRNKNFKDQNSSIHMFIKTLVDLLFLVT